MQRQRVWQLLGLYSEVDRFVAIFKRIGKECGSLVPWSSLLTLRVQGTYNNWVYGCIVCMAVNQAFKAFAFGLLFSSSFRDSPYVNFLANNFTIAIYTLCFGRKFIEYLIRLDGERGAIRRSFLDTFLQELPQVITTSLFVYLSTQVTASNVASLLFSGASFLLTVYRLFAYCCRACQESGSSL